MHLWSQPIDPLHGLALSAGAAILVGNLAGELRVDAEKLVKPFLQLGLLLLQQLDLLQALLAAERERAGRAACVPRGLPGRSARIHRADAQALREHADRLCSD